MAESHSFESFEITCCRVELQEKAGRLLEAGIEAEYCEDLCSYSGGNCESPCRGQESGKDNMVRTLGKVSKDPFVLHKDLFTLIKHYIHVQLVRGSKKSIDFKKLVQNVVDESYHPSYLSSDVR